MPMSSPVQNITSPLLSCSDNLRAAAQCSGLEEIFDHSLSLNDIASPSGAWTVAFKRSLRASRTWRGHLPSWASRSIPSRSILRPKTKWYFKVFSLIILLALAPII
jgi:hypothetical protein